MVWLYGQRQFSSLRAVLEQISGTEIRTLMDGSNWNGKLPVKYRDILGEHILQVPAQFLLKHSKQTPRLIHNSDSPISNTARNPSPILKVVR